MKLSLLLLLLITAVYASGQPKCKVEYYSTEQGLSHQRVTIMLKDRDGFMWFGSWDGINRFDGQKFISYKSSPGDKSHLGNDRIDQIVEDQSGHLWIQAYDRQVYRFDKKTEQFLPISSILGSDNLKVNFTRILSAGNDLVWLQSLDKGLFSVPQNDLSKDGIRQYKKELSPDYRLPSNTINFFHEDLEHQIWIGTPEGLSCLARSASGVYKNSNLVPGEIAAGMNVAAIDEDAGHLYFTTADGKLIIYDKAARSFSFHYIASVQLNAFLRSKITDVIYFTTSAGDVISYNLHDGNISKVNVRRNESLHSLYEDSKGILWIEPEKSGAIRFNPSDHSFQYFSQKTEEALSAIGNRFRVLEDNNGVIWVNLKAGGFGYYNETKANVAYSLNTPDAANYQLPNLVYAIHYDSAGILWLTTYEKELVKIVIQGNGFKQQLLVEKAPTPYDNEIRGVFYDNQNRLWLGAKSGNLHLYQNGKPIHGLFDNESREKLGLVYAILQDSRGNVWFATKANGLFKATPLNKEQTRYHLVHFVADKNDSNSLRGNDIYTLLEDRQSRIWIGSFDEGLNLVQSGKDSAQFVHSGNVFKNRPKEGFQKIRHMAQDAAGNIWIATTNGLLLVDARQSQMPFDQYKTYSKIPGDFESLGNNDIQFIYRDSKNRMWLGTSGGGFSEAIGTNPFQSLKFRNYTTRDGLPNDYVLSCAEDKQGNIWIATENGLSRFDPDTKTFRNYDSYDGLPKLSFSEAAATRRLPDGQLVFGTTQGFLFFNPELISTNRIRANIALTNLQINNEETAPGTKGRVLESNINYVTGLTLQYNQNIISIDYAILDYRAGNRQVFAYRLLGFDSTWYNDRQFRRATYTGLQPGNYVFEVKSLSTDLYLNQPYRRLAINILPPPWKTWWAYTLYVIAIAVMLFFIRRYALAMIRLRNKIAIEQKLAALKMNFFTNVSHELRTPLTLIVNPLEQVARKGKLSPELASYIEVARKNADRMVRFINQLLDLRKVQSDKATLRLSRVEMVTFVKKVAGHFTEAARSKRIRLDITSQPKELLVWVDAEKLDVVIFNVIGNAVKFSPAGKLIRIHVAVIPGEQAFIIALSDQGPGVAKEKLEDIFELFHEGDGSNGKELKGTGIGLALSREFVNLHSGRIWAENNSDGGLTITIKLKLGAEHYNQGDVSFVDLPDTAAGRETPIEQQLLTQSVYTSSSTDGQAPLVLLVEDNDELRTFIKGQLGEFYRVETAPDGEEGLQKALDLIPDLIVSDIMMPKMDGIQLLDRIKNNVNTSHIPVVLLSARYSIESQIEGLQYGADYYITKPFNSQFLIASIDNLLRQRKKLFEALVERRKMVDLSPSPVVMTSKDELFLKETIKVVEERMADIDFNIESLAESMYMNPNTFYKKFKSLTGLTAVEFVRDIRLQRARQLLDAGGSNVSDVAYTVGFNNPKYFSTCFKEKYHVSPSDYLRAKAT